MTRHVVLGALVGALMVVSTGCSQECVDQFDCRNQKGDPPAGKKWACVNNKCQSQDVPPPSEGDAGTEMDAGTDAGTEMDAGTDAGTDAGMTVGEGGDCAANDNCMAGLFCDSSGGTSKKCQPLQIALTAAGTDGGSEAVVVRYKVPGSDPAAGTTEATNLSENSTTAQSRFPRWNKDGTAVAFVEDTGGSVTLVTRNLPLTPGQTASLTTGTAAGTLDFRYMEWEPSSSIAWCTTTKPASTEVVSGISVISGTGGAVQTATTNGVFPSWSADGNSFAYSVNTQGLRTKALAGSDSAVAGAPATSEQPLHNKANDVLLYLDAGGKSESIGAVATPLTELFSLNPSAAGTPAPVSVAAVTSTDVAGGVGQLKSYIANHTWAPGGTHAAYVRVYYFKSTSGDATLCTGGTECAGKQGNIIYVRRVDASGTPQGNEMMLAAEATLPAFSPDGRFLAYLSGGKLRVQQLNPDATAEASLPVGPVITHTWSGLTVPSNRGDDHRPRWQPR